MKPNKILTIRAHPFNGEFRVTVKKSYGFGRLSPQCGSGASNAYRGVLFQRGHGWGSALKGIWKFTSPYLWKGAKAVGKEVLSSTPDILNSIVGGERVDDSLKQGMVDVGRGLVGRAKRKLDTKLDLISNTINNRQRGSGHKRRKLSIKKANVRATGSKKRAALKKSILPYKHIFQ